MSIGSKDGAAVDEAQRRIELILDPPTAEVGAVYKGTRREHHQVRRVRQHPSRAATVSIHISKLGRGKRIDRVEDVLSLGDELERARSTTSTRTASSRSRSSVTTPSGDGDGPAAAATRRGERPERGASGAQP